MTLRTETTVLVTALLALSRTLHSPEGVVEAALEEAAGRLRVQQLEIDLLREMWATHTARDQHKQGGANDCL